jgi:diguanylate cyclase (GGDEF)-like protein/PAS domain S-box-containing protein
MFRFKAAPTLAHLGVAAAAFALGLAVAQGPEWALESSVALALFLLAGAVNVRRRAKAENRLAQAALGSLAEYKLPSVHAKDAPLVSALVAAYEQFHLELTRRHASSTERLARYEFMAQYSDDLVLQVDGQGLLKYISPSVRQQMGYGAEDVLGTQVLDLLHRDDRERWFSEYKRATKARQSVLLEGRWRHQDGSYLMMEMSIRNVYGLSGSVVEAIAIARNVESRNAMRTKLEAAARTDGLTGLLNRAALVETLDHLKSTCGRKPFGLFLFDLDRFKQVNDSLGHAAGDDYLVETARRVSSVLREHDVFARMGGDEFVALFTNVTSEDALRAIAARIIEEVTKPYLCHGELLYPKTSIGILLCDDPAMPTDELISRADRAMYVAKDQGGNLAVVYDDTQADTLRKSFAVEQELTTALQENRLALQFQPIVDAKTKRPALAEALVRMRASDGSLIGPGHFIEVAEKSGLIFQVGAWVLEQACLQARRLEEAGHATSISVNVSPRQLMHLNYVRSVEEVLERTGVSPSSIVLEVTESAVMQDVQRALDTLNHLRSLGFKLALDDFGSGYSSISMLKSLPFDILKIDRAFVADAEGASIGPSTLAAIIDIGKSLNLTIIAEGIETERQSLGLERLGCDLLQGFLFHRPIDPDDHCRVVAQASEALITGRNLKTVADDVVLF